MSSNSAATPVAAFRYSGYIVDERGTPVANADVVATHQHRDGQGFGYIDTAKSDARGHFAISRNRARSGAYPASVTGDTIQLEFTHPDHQYAKLEDMHAFSSAQATALTVTLREGRTFGGQVVDAARQPVAGARVEVTFGKLDELRRGTTTDANGRFAFRGLPEETGEVRVLTVDTSQPALTARQPLGATQTDAGEIVLAPVALPPDAVVHELFGMKLVDVDASLQTAFHLPRADGVLVLDLGARRLGLELQRGDQFCVVGDEPIANFAAFARRMLTLSADGAVRVVYLFSRPEFAGGNTQYVTLSAADRAELVTVIGEIEQIQRASTSD